MTDRQFKSFVKKQMKLVPRNYNLPISLPALDIDKYCRRYYGLAKEFQFYAHTLKTEPQPDSEIMTYVTSNISKRVAIAVEASRIFSHDDDLYLRFNASLYRATRSVHDSLAFAKEMCYLVNEYQNTHDESHFAGFMH